MHRFAELLDRLVLTPARNGKLRLLVDYFRTVEDPDRGLALAAITGDLSIAAVKPAMLRYLVEERVDPVLFGYSYDYVGDLAETVSLVWPEPQERGQEKWTPVFRPDARQDKDPPPRLNHPLTLGEAVARLQGASRSDGPKILADLLDCVDVPARFAIIKLVTGGLRIGVSARLAKQAAADLGGVDVGEIEQLWHGLAPPYTDLFQWLEGKGPKPESRVAGLFRPVMLSNAVEEGDLEKLEPTDYAAEWKWDGIRVQVVSERGVRRLYSRTADDASPAFPDLVEAMTFDAVLDGELLVGHPSEWTGTFSDLQQRLNRKTVSAKMREHYPVFIRSYDVLQIGEKDTRALPYTERRERLKELLATLDSSRFDLSPEVHFSNWDELDALRMKPPHPVIEGIMLKQRQSPYLAGRPKGPWFKWKRDPHTIDAVLMYAQRGHGKRSSYYSDFTFGVWEGSMEASALVPVGKAYFGFTDEELRQLDKYVRDNTTERFGPVRSIRAEPDHGLVLEVAFEGLNRSPRHRSGVAMRFPRISRIRWDKPAYEADRIDTLTAMLDSEDRAKSIPKPTP